MQKSTVRFRVLSGPLTPRRERPRAGSVVRSILSGFRIRLDLSFIFRRTPR